MSVQDGSMDEMLVNALAAHMKRVHGGFPTSSKFTASKNHAQDMLDAAQGSVLTTLLKTVGKNLVKTRIKAPKSITLNNLDRASVFFTTEAMALQADVELEHEVATTTLAERQRTSAGSRATRASSHSIPMRKQVQDTFEADMEVTANQPNTPAMVLLTKDSIKAQTWLDVQGLMARPGFKPAPAGNIIVMGSPPWGIRGAANAAVQRKKKAAAKKGKTAQVDKDDASDTDTDEDAGDYKDVALTAVEIASMVRVCVNVCVCATVCARCVAHNLRLCTTQSKYCVWYTI